MKSFDELTSSILADMSEMFSEEVAEAAATADVSDGIEIGQIVTGKRFPHRTYRKRAERRTGKVVRLWEAYARIQTDAGFFLIERASAVNIEEP